MSKQERQDGARANTRDAKRRCEEEEEDRHARQNPQRRGRNKLNVWRSLMSLQILSTVPLGPKHARISVCVGARVCVCVCLHLWNTGLCIIYQTAVSFVLPFTLRARSRANRDPSQREWQPPKRFNWRLKQLIMPSLSLQSNYLSMEGMLTRLIC